MDIRIACDSVGRVEKGLTIHVMSGDEKNNNSNDIHITWDGKRTGTPCCFSFWKDIMRTTRNQGCAAKWQGHRNAFGFENSKTMNLPPGLSLA